MVAGVWAAENLVDRAVDFTSSLVIVAIGLVAGGVGYLLGVRVFRITEISDVLKLVASGR